MVLGETSPKLRGEVVLEWGSCERGTADSFPRVSVGWSGHREPRRAGLMPCADGVCRARDVINHHAWSLNEGTT